MDDPPGVSIYFLMDRAERGGGAGTAAAGPGGGVPKAVAAHHYCDHHREEAGLAPKGVSERAMEEEKSREDREGANTEQSTEAPVGPGKTGSWKEGGGSRATAAAVAEAPDVARVAGNK